MYNSNNSKNVTWPQNATDKYHEYYGRQSNSSSEEPAMIRMGNYDLTPAQVDAYHRYRDLVGFTKPNNLIVDQSIKARYLFFTTSPKDENKGLYQQIVDEELRAHIWYRTSTWTSNVLLALQVGLAAAITALASTTNTNKSTVLTVLGALNTVIAAGLTFLKAKSLPASASHYRDRMKKQRSEIDHMHREFCIGSAMIDPLVASNKAHDDFNKAHNEFDTTISSLQRTASTFNRIAMTRAGGVAPAHGAAPLPAPPSDPEAAAADAATSSTAGTGTGIGTGTAAGASTAAATPATVQQPSVPGPGVVPAVRSAVDAAPTRPSPSHQVAGDRMRQYRTDAYI